MRLIINNRIVRIRRTIGIVPHSTTDVFPVIIIWSNGYKIWDIAFLPFLFVLNVFVKLSNRGS